MARLYLAEMMVFGAINPGDLSKAEKLLGEGGENADLVLHEYDTVSLYRWDERDKLNQKKLEV